MTLVWYAAYGSNLSRERFDVYLRGGTPDGASHTYPGCRDASDPRDDRALELDGFELCFGGHSQTWGGGVAFVRHREHARVKARLYLVTHDQFCDVVAQENWLDPGTVDIAPDEASIGELMYGTVPRLGSLDGHPVRTLTQGSGAELRAPSPAYAAHIALGLHESHGLDDAEIDEYLRAAPGME